MARTLLHSMFRFIAGLIVFLIISAFTIVDFKFEPEEPVNIEPANPEFFHKKNITDGPYVFYENNKIVVRWIKGDRLISKTILTNKTNYFKRKFGFEISIDKLKKPVPDTIDYTQKYDNIDNFIVISDVHGQLDLSVQLLKQYKVIDANLNWSFGKGHLVILGDILDRGDKVTELLWLVYRLEQQSELAGGKVHYLLGNHELMVLNNDLRYIHEKYIHASKKMNMVYSQLFANNTFFGQWLRTKPAIVTINDVVFVHAGISTKFIANGLTPEKTNAAFHQKVLGKSWEILLSDPISTFLVSNQGPLWHRGFFKSSISDYQVNYILNYLKANHLVVGHTSMPNIISIKGGKIIGVDSNIKEGNYGEILIFKDKTFYRGTSQGSIMKLEPEKND